ncbi:DUF5991 domain-containing protein [Bacteroides fragilis]|uniref:DUF5991 domain-containing protein n=1 Tax=Bacteroides fragilis TaxID=817 RepID=UPI0022AB3CF8|nr:DUF5991 domain-containing protein [Bacteroides fragilis]MCZ2664663.1 DUF5991 domain-containing protein [Bacteroides fragilis]
MNRKWILITLCIILLSGCINFGKRSSTPKTQSPGNETEQSEHAISQHWIGSYSLYILSGETIQEDASNIGVGYDFEIQDSMVSFTAEGFQTFFVCECSIRESKDQLLLLYKRKIEETTTVPFRNEGDTVALIICEQGKYYVQSPVIPVAGWVYNQKILLEKEPVNTSEESDHDSIPEITYCHEDFEYGTEEDHLDRWVIPIDEAEFLAASANYKNIQPDSTVQLPTDQGSYSVSLENGHTKVLSDCYEQSDAYRKYLYKGYLAEMNCYVFEYEGLEWEGISYVSKANGEEYGLRTQALFSLNQNCYCVDACTELEGERAGIIKVFQVSGGEFKFMFGLWSDKIFPQTVCWKDNTTLYVKALREENGADQTYYYKIPLDQVQ